MGTKIHMKDNQDAIIIDTDTKQSVLARRKRVAPADLIFKGEFTHQLDEKYRFKLPVKMQEAFEEFGVKAVFMKMPEKCLALFPQKAWEQEFGKYLSGSNASLPGNADYRELSRLIASRSTDAKIGVQGRVAIPEGYREYIGIQTSENIVITGAGDRLEIWSEEEWKQKSQGSEEILYELLEKASERIASSERDTGEE